MIQISLRKHLPVNKARIIGSIITFAFGTMVEILQLYGIEILGRTFDPWDIFMYIIGIGLGIAIDLTVIDKFEKQKQKNK